MQDIRLVLLCVQADITVRTFGLCCFVFMQTPACLKQYEYQRSGLSSSIQRHMLLPELMPKCAQPLSKHDHELVRQKGKMADLGGHTATQPACP